MFGLIKKKFIQFIEYRLIDIVSASNYASCAP